MAPVLPALPSLSKLFSARQSVTRLETLEALTTPRGQRTPRQHALSGGIQRPDLERLNNSPGDDFDYDFEIVPEYRDSIRSDQERYTEWKTQNLELAERLESICCVRCFLPIPSRSSGQRDYSLLTEGLPEERQPKGVKMVAGGKVRAKGKVKSGG